MIKSLRPQFPNEKGEFLKAAKSYHLFLSLCCDLFEKESWVPDDWLMSLALFRRGFAKEVLSENEMRGLLAAMTGYGKRIQGDARQSQRVSWAGKSYSEVFVNVCNELAAEWPQLANAPIASSSSDETFKVTRYWNLFRQVPMDQKLRQWNSQPVQRGWHNTEFLNTDGACIWLSHEKAGVLNFDPRTLQTEVFGTPPGESGDQVQQIVATANEICAASRHALWRFDRSLKQWAKLDVPDAPYSLGRSGDEVLVAYAAGSNAVKGGGAGSGIGHLTQGGVKWLVSTRRRPVEHALDAIDVQEMCGIFAGPGGNTWTSLCEYGQGSKFNSFMGKVYSLEASSSSEIQPQMWFNVFPCGDRTLLWETWSAGRAEGQRSRGIQAWCVRPSAAEPELLIRSEMRFQLPVSIQPRWQTSAMLENLPPDTYSSYLCPTMHGDELWMLYRYEHGDKQVLLIGMLPGRKDPVCVPLSFVFSEVDRAAVPRGFYSCESDGTVHFSTQKHGITSTDHALALCSSLGHGVWLIPWADIHDWLAKHPQP